MAGMTDQAGGQVPESVAQDVGFGVSARPSISCMAQQPGPGCEVTGEARREHPSAVDGSGLGGEVAQATGLVAAHLFFHHRVRAVQDVEPLRAGPRRSIRHSGRATSGRWAQGPPGHGGLCCAGLNPVGRPRRSRTTVRARTRFDVTQRGSAGEARSMHAVTSSLPQDAPPRHGWPAETLRIRPAAPWRKPWTRSKATSATAEGWGKSP